MRAMILLGLLQAPPEAITKNDRTSWQHIKQQTFQVRRSNGDLMTAYHPCGCIEVGLGEGIALLPCARHRGKFQQLLREEEKP